MTNADLLEILKAQIDTNTVPGLVSAQDASEFIDLAVDQTTILQELRVEKDIRKSFNLDTLYLSDYVVIAGVEGSAPDAADVIAAGHSRTTLTPTECLAAFDVTYSWLEKAITHASRGRTPEEAQAAAQQALNNLFAKRFGKDVVAIAFMGDTALPNDTRKNKALRVLDGVVKQAEADATVHDYTIPASPSYSTQVFPGMLRQLPKDYADDLERLGFFVSSTVYRDYLAEMGTRQTSLGDRVMEQGARGATYMGIGLHPVFGLDDGRIVLTIRENLAVGFGRDMRNESERKPRARKVEVTITAEMDTGYASGDAIVLGATS